MCRTTGVPAEVSAVDFATGLASALPKGLYTGRGLERYVEEVLSDPDRTNDFRLLENELYTDADGWTLRSADGSRGAHSEHTIAITDDGPLVLTKRAS